MAAGGGGTTLSLNLTAAGGSQVTATLNQAAGAAERAGGSFDGLGRIGQAATYALGQAIYGVTAKLTQMAESVAASGVKTAATIESQTIALQGLTGSAGAANTLMAQLMETAKKTPFDTDNVIAWGEKLLGAGMTADHVNQTVNTLGDTFSHFGLSNDQASHAMLAWTQMMNAGVIHAQDLNQLVQAGIPIYTLFAKATGENAAQFKKQVETGTVLSKDVLPALEAYANKNFMGSMSAQAGTLSGMWENLKDTVNLGIATAIKPAEPAIKHALGDAMIYAGRATEWLAATGVPKLMEFGRAVKDRITAPLHEMVDYIQANVLPKLSAMASWCSQNAANIASMAASIALAVGAFKAANTVMAAMGALSNPVTAALVGIAALAAAAGYAYTNFQPFHDFVDRLAKNVLPAFATAITNVGNFWKTYLQPPLQDAANTLLPKLQAVWKAVVDNFGSGSAVFKFVQQVFAVLGPILKDVVIPAFTVLAGVLLDQLKAALTGVGWLLSNILIPLIKELATGFITAVGAIIHGAADAFGWVPNLGPKLRQAAGWFDGFKNDVNNSLAAIDDSKSITLYVTRTDSHGNTIQRDANVMSDSPTIGEATFYKGLGLKGKNNETKIWNYLRKQGFSSGAAAGVIGNLIAESGLDPGIYQRGGGPGRGLAQWSAGGRWDQLERWTQAHGLNSTSLDGQLAFMMHELGSGGFGSLSALKHMSANDAAAYFMNHYEMPASRNPSGRQAYARAVLHRHGGGTAGTPKGNGYQHLSGAPPFDTSTIKDDLGPRSSFMKSVLAGRSELQDQFYKLLDDVNKAGNAHAHALVWNYSKSLLALAKVHDAVVKRLKDAQDQVKKIRDASQQLYDQTRQNIIKTGDVTTGEGKDFGSIASRMQNAVNAAKNFASLVAKLRASRLNTETLEQIIAAGPEQGMAYGQSILGQGKTGIGKINDLEKQLEKAGGSVGKTASDAMYKAALASATGFAKGLASQKSKLEALMTSLAKTMAKALRKALGIKSPSRVFMEIGQFTADGLIHGMNARQSAVNGAASDLLSVGMGSRRLRSVPTRQDAPPPVVVHVHGYVGSETQLARQITQTLTRASGRGVNGAA